MCAVTGGNCIAVRRGVVGAPVRRSTDDPDAIRTPEPRYFDEVSVATHQFAHEMGASRRV